MSTKRVANSKLDHENWDQEEEAEEAGTFRRAAAEDLKTRVIKTARRKITGDGDGKKSAFSGFTGFGVTKPDSTQSPFSFLAKIASAAPKQPEIAMEVTSATATVSNQNEFHSKLKGLNQSVLNWIKTHVESNPVCILTPIFDDYNKFLKEIESKYKNKDDSTAVPEISSSETKIPHSTFDENKNTNSTFSGFKFTSTDSFKPAPKVEETPALIKPTPMSEFKFSSTPASVELPKPTGLAGFKFGAIPSASELAKPSFSAGSGITFGTNSTAPLASSTPSSFALSKPFTFANVAAPPIEEKKDDEVDEDQPPKVEFIENEEKDSVFSIKCKLFVKHDGNFTDRGVGTLHIKPVKDADKTQVIIRAGTSLGTILLNIMLTESVPLQRMGKNNVMMVCIPTPDSKTPPTPILVRVKTGEEADELLETLKKYVK